MSGNDGIRGYIIQTIICLLDALETDNKWIAVTLEPLDESEKVDIRWKYPNNRIKFSQVKSSKNIINFSDAKKWSEELETQSKNAFEYELILVGNVDKKLSKTEKIGNVKIGEFRPLNIKFLIDQASTKIDKYYERKRKPKISSKIRELIIGNLNTHFGTSSISGSEIERNQFDHCLLDWIVTIQNETEKNPYAIYASPEENDEATIDHRLIKKILELVGWNQFGENYSVESFNEKLSQIEMHNINFIGDFESKLKEKSGDFIMVSAIHDIQYPISSKSEINKYLKDTSQVFNHFKEKNKIPLKKFDETDYYSLLFWFSTDNSEITNDFIYQVKENYKDLLLDDEIMYFFIDNNKINFLINSIITAKNYREDIPVKFLYPITEANQSPGKIGQRGLKMPTQYINSSVIPLIKEDSSKISFLLFCLDLFSLDTLKKMIWLAIRLTSGFGNEYLLYFPDYDELKDKNSALEIVRSFNDELLDEKIKIIKYSKIDMDKFNLLTNTKTIVNKNEIYKENEGQSVSDSSKYLNEAFINILPYGDILKPFLNTDAITSLDLKIFLAKKGIYIKSNNKKKLINIISSLLLSPNELEDFKSYIDVKSRIIHSNEEFYKIKQNDSLNNIFNKIKLNLDNISEGINTKIVNMDNLIFTKNDDLGNEYILSLITEIKDPTSSLSVNTTWGKSEIVVKKESDDVVMVTMNTITKDDKYIANRIVKSLNEEFIKVNFVEKEKTKVLFKMFKSNIKRVNFLLSFSNISSSKIFKEASIHSIKFKFDHNQDIPDRYKDKADTDLIINYSNGKNLQSLDELSTKSAKEAIFLEEMKILYKFDFLNIKNGSINITYNFSNALKNKAESDGVFRSEPALSLTKSIKNIKDIETLKKELSKEIERLKLEKLRLFNIIK